MNTYEPPAPVIWSLDDDGARTVIRFQAETPIDDQNTVVWIAQYACTLDVVKGVGDGAVVNVQKNGVDANLDADLELNTLEKAAPSLKAADYAQGDTIAVLIPKGNVPLVAVHLEFARL